MGLLVRAALKSIENLKYVKVEELIENDNDNVVPMWLSNVRSLGLLFERSKDVKAILKALVKSNRLHSLYIHMDLVPDSADSFLDLEPLSQCQHLSKLFLSGKIREEYHVLKFLPPNIVNLTLGGSKMKEDPMVVLEKLPHLRILRLGWESYKGSKMKCSTNGFLQLHSHELELLYGLEEWEIEEGAMPRLQSLKLSALTRLKMFPEGLRYVTALQEMKLDLMKRSLVERIQGREGYDFYKVSHIPYVQED